MKLDGNAICYLLNRQFPDVIGHIKSSDALFSFALLYEKGGDLAGHCAVVPPNVLLDAETGRPDVMYVCLGEQSARAAIDAGLSVIHVRGGMTEQQVLNRMITDYMSHLDLETQLHTYIDTYAGFKPLFVACAQAMGCSCALVDRFFRVVCQADEEAGGASSWLSDQLDYVDADIFVRSQRSRNIRASHKVFGAPGFDGLFLCNVYSDKTPVGMLVFAHDGTPRGARYVRFLMQYLAPFVEEMYAHLGTFGTTSESASRVKSALANALNGASYNAEEIAQILAEETGTASGRYAVLRFERMFNQENPDEADYLAWRIELGWPNAYCVSVDEKLFALVDLEVSGRTKHEPFTQGLASFVRDALCKVGMSREFSSFDQLSAACVQASAALAQGNVDDPMNWIYRFDDYALEWIISQRQLDVPASYVVHTAFATLSGYDAEYGAQLVETLRTFIRCRYNATDAAAKLYVARSTLLNRLARIVELTHIDLDDFDERLYLAVSFKLLESEPNS